MAGRSRQSRLLAEAYDGEHAFQLYTASNGGKNVKIADHLIVRDGQLVSSEVVVDGAAFMHSWQVDHLPWGEFADWRCCTQVPHTVHGMHAMHRVDLPRSVGCSQHPQDLGVGRGQAEWVMTRGAVAGSEVGDNQARPQRVGPRCQMRVV